MIIEERLKIKGDVELGTTIAYEDRNRKSPLVVLIMGTGGLDRDGNSKSLKLNIYKDLSDYFVGQGCVCVRYDKRATYESGGKISDHTLSGLIDDAGSVVDYCSKLPFVDEDRVIVCGHSEGAMVGTLLSEKKDFEGLILLSGAGTSLKDASYYQNERLMNEAKNGKGFVNWLLRKTINEDKVSSQIEAMYDKANKSKKDMFFYRGAILPTTYIKEHGALSGVDYIEKLKKYKGKVLAITGTGDVQANYEVLSQLEGQDNIEVHAPDGVNHILREVDDNNSILTVMKQYKRLSKEPLHKETLSIIGEWLHKNFEMVTEEYLEK